jgi:hypothetical protein
MARPGPGNKHQSQGLSQSLSNSKARAVQASYTILHSDLIAPRLGETEGNNPGCWWLTPVRPATQKAEIRRIKVQSQPGQIVCETLSQKNFIPRKTAGDVPQGVGP